MKPAITLLLAAAVVVGCSSTSTSNTALSPTKASGELSMTMSFDPSPPKQGSETIMVSIKDASGKAVKGASVTIATRMPKMSMTGPNLTLQDNGDGTYSAVTNLNYSTTWVFDVNASQAGKSAKAEFDQKVP